MEVQLEDPAEEIKRLRRCINDLVSVIALPAIWSGSEPAEMVRTLLDVLLGMLHLDLIYVRLEVAVNKVPIEMLRVAQFRGLTAGPQEIGELFNRWLGDDPQTWPPLVRNRIEDEDMTIVPLRMGLQGEIGVIVAGSQRADFPRQTEGLVLSVAANQAAIGLQEARLLNEQKRVAGELDQRVAQRTTELAAANEELIREIAERKWAEEALRTSEINLRQIVDSIPGLVCTLSPAGEVIHLNRQVLEYFGKTAEELKGSAFTDAVHPDDCPRVLAAFRNSITTGEPYDIEHRCRRADGVYRWFQVRALPVRDTNGCITGWYVLLIDIDARVFAEDAIRASERDLNHIINTIPVLAWCNFPDGSNEFLNQPWHDYTGLTPEQAHGWGWQVAIHPDDLPKVWDKWREHLVSGEAGEVEARLRRFDGVDRWFLFRANPLRDESGNIVKWYGTNTDIDDRKRAEEELRRNEAFLAEAQYLSQIGSFSWRVATGEITWSEQLYRIFEFDPNMLVTLELIGTRVHPKDMHLLQDMTARAQDKAHDFGYEHRLLMPDHSVKYLHLIAHATRDRDGQLEYIGAIQDVTQRRHSEEALGKARSELAHVSRVTTLGALTASIAHEVNQPLSGIITNAGTCLRMLAADPPNVDGARETARRTIRDGNRASDVIKRLRALFSKKNPTTELMDLNEATREVIALSLSKLQRNGVILRPELADDLPLVTGDRVQLQQVIMNLLLNASEAMSGVDDRPRQAIIKTEGDEGDRVRLTVQDAGVGFEPQDVNRLFEAFYTTKRDGMGIGLSVSRSIIESHHGHLWATPNDGPGATFSFTIPRASESVTGATSLGAIQAPALTDAAPVRRKA
jgi:PAS domain S-box-containing protein